MSEPALISQGKVSSLADLLRNTPFQLTAPLIRLGPYISLAAHLAQIISWRSDSWYDSWLLLLGWFAVCLFSGPIVRFCLPLAVVVLYHIVQKRFIPFVFHQTSTASEQNIESIVQDLHTLQILLPIPTSSKLSLSFRSLVRLVILLTPLTTILINLLIPPRVLLGLTGAIILTWRAPWAAFIRTRLWRSAWIRWTSYHIWARLTATTLPYSDFRATSQKAFDVQTTGPKGEKGSQLRFLFTVYENQRWWMGLDFTAALLPNERPSWSSGSLHPVQPPTSFSLPESTSVVSVTQTKDGKTRKTRRTATWRWEDPEWTVLVRTEGSSALSRIERPLPSLEDGNARNALLAKAAGKIQRDKEREASLDSKSSKDGEVGEDVTEGGGKDAAAHDVPPEEETLTDADGWVYGDNKWEGLSHKGGMGKYTRYRRWTRVAVVEEHIEELPDDYELPPPSTRRSSTMSHSTSVHRSSSRTSDDSSPTRSKDTLRNRLRSITSNTTTT